MSRPWLRHCSQLLLLAPNKPPALSCHHLHDIIGHMTIGFVIYGLLYVINVNQPSILNSFLKINIKPQRYCVTTLTFWGYVTSSATWPSDSQRMVSYRWSLWTDRLSRTIVEILSFKDIGAMTLTFRVTWGHRLRYHWTRNIWFPIGVPLKPTLSLPSLLRCYVSNTQRSIVTPIENAPIPILGGKIGGYSILQLCAMCMAAPVNTVTVTVAAVETVCHKQQLSQCTF